MTDNGDVVMSGSEEEKDDMDDEQGSDDMDVDENGEKRDLSTTKDVFDLRRSKKIEKHSCVDAVLIEGVDPSMKPHERVKAIVKQAAKELIPTLTEEDCKEVVKAWDKAKIGTIPQLNGITFLPLHVIGWFRKEPLPTDKNPPPPTSARYIPYFATRWNGQVVYVQITSAYAQLFNCAYHPSVKPKIAAAAAAFLRTESSYTYDRLREYPDLVVKTWRVKKGVETSFDAPCVPFNTLEKFMRGMQNNRAKSMNVPQSSDYYAAPRKPAHTIGSLVRGPPKRGNRGVVTDPLPFTDEELAADPFSLPVTTPDLMVIACTLLDGPYSLVQEGEAPPEKTTIRDLKNSLEHDDPDAPNSPPPPPPPKKPIVEEKKKEPAKKGRPPQKKVPVEPPKEDMSKNITSPKAAPAAAPASRKRKEAEKPAKADTSKRHCGLHVRTKGTAYDSLSASFEKIGPERRKAIIEAGALKSVFSEAIAQKTASGMVKVLVDKLGDKTDGVLALLNYLLMKEARMMARYGLFSFHNMDYAVCVTSCRAVPDGEKPDLLANLLDALYASPESSWVMDCVTKKNNLSTLQPADVSEFVRTNKLSVEVTELLGMLEDATPPPPPPPADDDLDSFF